MRWPTLAVLLIFYSCGDPSFSVLSLVPEYFDPLDFESIETLEPQSVVNQGMILQLENYLFINDKKRGIHVVENSVPGNPFYEYFWNIPGNSTFTIEENYLFADNGPHMLVINISNFGNIKYERYIEGVFYENMREQFPEEAEPGSAFVCPEPEKGLVKSWRQEYIENPNCERI